MKFSFSSQRTKYFLVSAFIILGIEVLAKVIFNHAISSPFEILMYAGLCVYLSEG